MKKLLVLILISMLYVVPAHGDDGDITVTEVVPDIASWKPVSLEINIEQKVAVVIYRKYDSGGISTGNKRTIVFNNVGGSEFTQLIAKINAESNIKLSVANAVKTKLGL